MLALAQFKQRVRELESATLALYLAARHPATPWYAKLLATGIAAYAFSPIDLIPDFIPVLGLLDDLILLPLGIALAIKLIPQDVMTECRARAAQAFKDGKPISRLAATVIIAIWLGLVMLAILWGYKAFSN
ncbi:MAG: DUF1232 domain-containing protein [Steroidobacteraceae bacterium]